ncbi:right-handed parallel beta-helix repeat-containing protein [Candidatus Bipolaricaulota bacterium]|nr:right-handed parallel beta-helix repeat-containing protein [Candidatus Bipolaricaulota bacterium]
MREVIRTKNRENKASHGLLERLKPWVTAFGLTLLTTIFFSGFFVQAARLQVCRVGCDYTSIFAAVEAAAPGDRLTIEAGRYSENVTIDKNITLVGTKRGQVVIKPAREGRPILTIEGSELEVTLKGLTVSSASGAPVDREGNLYPDGISIQKDVRLNLVNVTIMDNEECGLRVTGNSEVDISGSSLARNGKAGCLNGDSSLLVEDTRISGNGLVLSETATVAINDSTISNHRSFGLKLKDSSKGEIKTSKIGTCNTCILLSDESFLELIDSTVSDAADGVRLMKNSRAYITDTEFTDCTSGLDLRENSYISLSDSRITSNDHGIALFGNSKLEIENCRVAYNDIGIRANPGSEVQVSGCGVRFYINSEGDTVGLEKTITERLQDRCGS